jgi:hypothetical protein
MLAIIVFRTLRSSNVIQLHHRVSDCLLYTWLEIASGISEAQTYKKNPMMFNTLIETPEKQMKIFIRITFQQYFQNRLINFVCCLIIFQMEYRQLYTPKKKTKFL